MQFRILEMFHSICLLLRLPPFCDFQTAHQVEIVSPLMDEDGSTHPYFSHYPLFGLPTEVEDCEILYKNDNL